VYFPRFYLFLEQKHAEHTKHNPVNKKEREEQNVAMTIMIMDMTELEAQWCKVHTYLLFVNNK